ncbi:MAG TPA: SDR family NAD(P)-dependent oxidoreductase [Thermoanaerobaculia bacterium]|nr:SDR family NAD(P)-dependent oxidoreductase [Thermoanaerobaculia bacterium]
MEIVKVAPVKARTSVEQKPLRILESKARTHPKIGPLVRELYDRYKYEGTASRGTRKIAPNLFIGGSRRGYFNYGRSKDIILVYGYSGAQDYLPTLREEMSGYCDANGLQLNFFSDGEIPPIAGRSFSATPFGVMQRIVNLKEFSLEGGAMRRLRYQVSKFQKAGVARTEEYRSGTRPDTDQDIARVIDRWCEGKTMVNPLVHEVKGEILAGTLPAEQRLFLTYLDEVLQNVILVDEMSPEINGYLMDLEFYPPEMPMGGLDLAIVQIVAILAAEGRDVLSLGGTYGVKIEPSATADPELDKLLDNLREQNIFNDESNLQFKNKFRPLTMPIFLCRPIGSGNPDNILDIIMMIADPERMQTPDEETDTFGDTAPPEVATVIAEPVARRSMAVAAALASADQVIEGNDRSSVLAEFGFNPLNIPHEHVAIDLKTDSWAQLEMPAIAAQMKHLHSRLQQPASVDDSLRAVFPFPHFVLTTSGQAAESIFFKTWPKKGVVPQNLLFPSTIFHQIDKGFTPRELPHPAVFQLNAREPYKGNMDLDALQALVAQDPAAIACVCIDVGNNASGGQPVSLQHLRDVRALLAAHSIPLVIDGTRVMENAQFLIEQGKECGGKSIWAVVREIFSCADAVIGSLTKDFCVNKGGIVAINDIKLFQRLQEVVLEEGAGLDLIDAKLIALSLQKRKHIEAKVLRRMEGVRLIWQALAERGVPVAQPAGGHCILIDVKQIPEFRALGNPVASFLAWLYLNTGIRAGAHSVGMQKRTPINDLVRLAIPVGLKREQIDNVIDRLVDAFGKKTNIPEIVIESSVPQPLGSVYAKFRLEKYHHVSGGIAAGTDAAPSSVAGPSPVSPEPAEVSSPGEAVVVDSVPAETPSAPTPMNARPRRAHNVAIVGMAGRYPKAGNVRELWENLAGGRDCIEEIPAERHERRLQHGSNERYRGGFIDGVDKFDSLFFNISPREAEMLDPQERLFLEVAWEAIEDAGYFPEILAREDTSRTIGVFVGAVWAMYQVVGVDEQRAGNEVAPNSFLWSIANRVSYWMNLSGPSLTVDTACSSSLTALYLACEAIQAGECSAAIVGGVNLDLHPAKLDINKIGGALSPDGVCRTFGKGANGYVAGEGIGALLLKPLDHAELDRDHIYGVIKGAVVNHGGRTSGYFVPNPSAQSNVIQSALLKANVAAGSIGYIEAHGTGTELGDPIEISGLNSAFSGDKVENQTCAIGSIKSNIGHLEAAAGVVAVSKVLLQMTHRQLVPSLHSSEPNEHIDFEHSPFYVVQKLEEWKAKEVDGVRLPLRAGISSFGAGGANAHIILESYEPAGQATEEPAMPSDLIFPLSARNEDQLRDAAVRLAQFLRQNRVDLRDAAYTLQQGRKSFEQRLAIIAKTQEELIEKLTLVIDQQRGDGIVAGHVKLAESVTRLLNRSERQEFVRMLSAGRDPHKIAALWAEGLLTDWQGFQSKGTEKRISLPTYPFAGKRHWIGDPSAVRRALQPVAGTHPMVDTNESTFERQLFKKTFHDRDFFIYDHLVSDIPTLPGVAYLELARVAGEIAAGRPVRRIQNILWVSPIVVENSIPKEVFIELKPSGDAVQFEVFSESAEGVRLLHSQGRLLYTNRPESSADPEFVDLDAIRARCAKGIDGKSAYPLFKSVGLSLGPSFQVLQEIYQSDTEVLGILKLPEFRQPDLQSMVLHPSLIDGSLQAGMAARLGASIGEMLVPYSIGEVEILHPLQSLCYSYTTEAGGKKGSRVLKSNVLILDETGKVLARIRESTGVPLGDVNKKSDRDAAEAGDAKVYYSYEWGKAPLTAGSPSRNAPQSILLFDTQETLRDLYQVRLTEAGATTAQIILVQPAASFRELDALSYEINPQSRDDFTLLFESLAERKCPIDEICFAWPVEHVDFRDEQLRGEALERGVFSFLFLCQSVIQAKLEGKVQLLYLYAARPDEAQPQNEAMSAFVKTLKGEYPRLLCKALEIRQEMGGYGQIVDAVWAELRARTEDASVVRYEAQERFTRRLTAFDFEETDGPPSSEGSHLREKGVYLITGGAGGLGLIFAEFLAKQYKARLILTGRSALSAEREAELEALRGYGAEVIYLLADVSSLDDVRTMVSESKSRFGEINGLIHAAGVVRDSYIRNKTPDEMSEVFAPKVHGTLHLDETTRNEALDFFVMFSSLAAVTGNVGQCDYSFANHFMDSFAADRERLRVQGERSGKTLSINWSLWAGGGMKPDEQTELLLRKAMGMKPLSAAAGIEAFVLGLASGRSQFAVLEGNAEKLELALGGRKKEPAPSPPPSSDHAAAAVVAAEGDRDLRELVQNDLSKIVMGLLKLDAADLSADKILLDLGFDSIGLTTFANAVNDKLQLDITPILFFDYPSIGEIATHLADERRSELHHFYRGSAAPSAGTPLPAALQAKIVAAESLSATFTPKKGWDPAAFDREASDRKAIPTASGEDVSAELRFVNKPMAIVGMSGVMPQSADLEEFWDNLKNSKDLVTVIPPDRWRWEDYFGDPLKEANKSNSKWGAFMKEIDKFDPLFFGISPREAQMMDPQQRIFLEQVWKAVEDSGQKVSQLAGTKTGIFVGVATNDYLEVITGGGAVLDGYSASGNSHAILANRVSFLLGLRGPSAPLDTACSSSLVAMHRAIESIHSGSCEMAIVGGVQVMLSPAAYISFSSAGMLSPDGKCKTFDKRANGYVRGEGCGAVFIKSLAAAEADGNHIYAVIKATAENHGGRVTAMTAPNASAQAELLIEAYEKGHLDPGTVGYIECHGTGTSLGDPIETQALSKAFAELYKRHGKAPADTPHCGLSSVKTNMGHLETAAGIAGILKALLAIKHQQIPANIHLEEVNPYINLKRTPFYIADKLTSWKAPVSVDGSPAPRTAGVSSFGFGGANAHVVLQEYLAPLRQSLSAACEPRLIVLSAKTEDRLLAYMQSIHSYLERLDVELIDLAYTLQIGRDEMPARLALVVSSTEELKQKLGQILGGGERPEDCYRGVIVKKTKTGDGAEGETGIQALIDRKELSKLAELWVSGATIDWRLLYELGVPMRISAPTYPFARERHWVQGLEGNIAREANQTATIGAARLHPLVHRNASTFEEQKFSTRFSGDEFYFTDHVVGTQKILPGVAYLEMARAAGEMAANANVRVIRNLVWERPLIVGNDATEVEVSLTPAKNEVMFAVRTVGGDHAITHCTGRLGYEVNSPAPERLDIAGIQERCSERVMSHQELYSFLGGLGLNLGKGFQIVRSICATETESLAILELPEHLKGEAGQFWLHPALMDGSLHTAIGLMKANGMVVPLSLPYSVGEVQIIHPLRDLHYGYATWGLDSKGNPDRQKVAFYLLDKNGTVLVRLKDFVNKPLPQSATNSRPSGESYSKAAQAQEELKAFLPVWNPVRFEPNAGVVLPESNNILMMGNRAQFDWVRTSYPNAQLLELTAASSVDIIVMELGDRSFDQLLWVAPDATFGTDHQSDGNELIIEQQEEGVLAIFRIIKALLRLGYANKNLQWTIVTCRTQLVTKADAIQPVHAGIVGLVGSLAKEYPHWDLRLLDVDSPASISARECLSLPWDKQGDALAHRHGEWFQQGLALVAALEETKPAYRQKGVYVVIGGAGGVGEVWSRFMIENFQANMVWIGRREYNAAIEAKINALSKLGPAPLYISADATNLGALAQARKTLLEIHPVIHGVVHSAIVLRDQSLSRMDESAFRASLSAKVDVSVNIDRVFGKDELDFMLFFSSIISVVKSPGQSNYAAGCTFKDSFAHTLQQQRPYAVKIMNWGYWGNVGVVADETYNRIMRQMGIGSIEPHEGMASLQTLIGSGLRQMALIKTLNSQATTGLNLTEAITFHPTTMPTVLPRAQQVLMTPSV